MPSYSLSFHELDQEAISLASGSLQKLAEGLNASFKIMTLRLFEHGKEIFKMTAETATTQLVIDRPHTDIAHRRRGLATLGVYLALKYGEHKGCTHVKLGTNSEPDAVPFWTAVGVGTTMATPITTAIRRIKDAAGSSGSTLQIRSAP
jgi:hypothetical protein